MKSDSSAWDQATELRRAAEFPAQNILDFMRQKRGTLALPYVIIYSFFIKATRRGEFHILDLAISRGRSLLVGPANLERHEMRASTEAPGPHSWICRRCLQEDSDDGLHVLPPLHGRHLESIRMEDFTDLGPARCRLKP